MRKIFFFLIVINLMTSSTCIKISKIPGYINELLPSPIQSFLSSQKKDIAESVKYGVESAKKMMEDVVVPISELPLYHYRAENKIYTLSELKKHGKFEKLFKWYEFQTESWCLLIKMINAEISPEGKDVMRAEYAPGRYFQRMAQHFGFFDMIDVKHVLCDFFYTSAEIVFYRGVDNFDHDILETVEKIGVLERKDIEPLEKLGLSRKSDYWYLAVKNQKLVPLMGELIGKEGEGKGYKLLSKEEVAIKKKYYELTNDIATFVWHLFFTYQEEYAPRENIVHQHLKREQIKGHLIGNFFALNMLNDTVRFHQLKDIYFGGSNLDTGSLKKEIKAFIGEIGYIYTKGKVDPFKEKGFIKKVVQYILDKLGIVKIDKSYSAVYKFKIEVLVILTKILETSDLDEKKAFKIIELCINNWKSVFFLHVSGTLTSSKPAPEFYNHHETSEEEDSFANFSDSDTLERDKSSFGSFGTTDDEKSRSSTDDSEDEDISEFGQKVLAEKDKIVKLLEDKNPFRDLLRDSFLKVNFNMRIIREQLIRSFEIICDHLLLKDDCSFIKHSIKNINTYVLIKDGRIAGRKWCYEHVGDCYKIEPKDYMLFLRKMTEIQGVSMGIVEYLILKSEEKQSLENLSTKQKIKLRQDIKDVFREYYFLRIFVTKEYRKALTSYAEGRKTSKIAKLAVARVEQIKKKIGIVPKKPPHLSVRDMDDVLTPDNSNRKERLKR